MTAVLRQTTPDGQVAGQPNPSRRGRPRGSIGPLALWLHPQIVRFKGQGASCTNLFRSLSVVEGGNARAFVVSPETADAYYPELGVDLAGIEVTLGNFRKIWGRTD